MRTLFFTITLLLGCCIAGTVLAEESYHFKEGFADLNDLKAKGWIRNCGGSTSANFIRGDFGGTYVPKFDKDSNGESKDFTSPEVNGAGKLSFWYKTNSVANRLSLHVSIIQNGQATEIKKIAYSEIKTDWNECSVNINLPAAEKFQIRFWAELEDAGATATLVIDDISLSHYTATEPEPEPETVERIRVNFSDPIWGEAIERPASGAYPSSEINGFKLTAATLITGGRIAMDKQSNGGCIEFPWLAGVEEIDIDASVGTEGNTFAVQEYRYDSWYTLESIVASKTTTTYTLNKLGITAPVKLRIANTSSGTTNIYRITTRTQEDVSKLSLLSSSVEEGAVCYYNLTKSITLTYNKELAAGTGTISLNETSIPVSACTFAGNTVSIPVSLSAVSSGNTAYTLSIPAGAFAESGNTENANAAININFSTYKTVAVPEGYTSLIDVAYLNADPAQNRMDIYFPENPEAPVPVVINIHGGGWNHGEKESQTGYAVYFKMGFAVANVEYRMTPQATAPAAIEDIRCAMMYLINNAASLNIDPTKIVLQGGSAGAHLAMTAAYLDQDHRFNPDCLPNKPYKIMAVIDKYGPSKLNDFMYYSSLVSWLGSYAGDEAFVKSISPYYLVNEQSAPTYIIHGDADPTVPYSQSEKMEEVLVEKGVKYQFTTVPGGGHGGFPDEYNTRMSEEITSFLQEILSGNSAINGAVSQKVFQPRIDGDTISLDIEGTMAAYVYDISGKLLMHSTEKELTVDRKGIVILKVITPEGVYIAKI